MPNETFDKLLNFDIDHYLNPYIPRNRLDAFPQPIRRFLGRRSQQQQAEPPAAVQWISIFVATLGALCLVGGLYSQAATIVRLHPPVLFASLGASAVLEYNTTRSPLAQPRNSIIGHTLAAIVGVGISKLFQLNPAFFHNYEWVVGAMACACASLVMTWTNSVHPPGGATAILACTQTQIISLGWWFVALILLASVLMLSVALLLNNIVRQYPVYWWTPQETGQKLQKSSNEACDGNNLERQTSQNDSEGTLQNEKTHRIDYLDCADAIHITPHKIQLPSDFFFSEEEISFLESLQKRLKAHAEDDE